MTPDPATHAHPSVVRAKRNARLIYYASAAVVTVVALVIAFVLLPYDAMTIYSFEPDVKEACPGEVVAVRRDYELAPWADVEQIEVDPSWVAVDAPPYAPDSILAGAEGSYSMDAERSGRIADVSALLRVAPSAPGEWRLRSEIIVRGTPYVVPFPKQQKLVATTTETVRVLPPGVQGCPETTDPQGDG